jgi:ABC-type Fe3+ transport system permease subunit
VGGGSSTQFLTQVPAQFQQIFLNGFHEAFSIALGNSMWIGVGAAIIACVSALFLHELPLRTTHAATEVPAAADQATEGVRVPVGADGLDRA